MDKKNVEDIYRVGNLQRRFTAKELKICVFEYTLNTSCGPSNLGKKKKKNLYSARFSQSSTPSYQIKHKFG